MTKMLPGATGYAPEPGASFPIHPEAAVFGVDDPRTPGRTAYEVSGGSAAVVQYAITELMEGENVVASEFTNPRKAECGLWIAIGYTTKEVQ